MLTHLDGDDRVTQKLDGGAEDMSFATAQMTFEAPCRLAERIDTILAENWRLDCRPYEDEPKPRSRSKRRRAARKLKSAARAGTCLGLAGAGGAGAARLMQVLAAIG